MTMKRKHILPIILAMSILLNIVLVAFAYIQKAAADDARVVAIESQVRALEMEQLAKRNEMMALEARDRAMREEARAKENPK
jgi:hypothetical protein